MVVSPDDCHDLACVDKWIGKDKEHALERFAVKLDNGDTVRLRGPNTTKPSPPRPAAAVSSATLPNSSHQPSSIEL